jgi:hypothetical protein
MTTLHPRNETLPDNVDLLLLAGMADRRSSHAVPGVAELSLILVLAGLEPDDEDVLACVVGNVYHMGRLVGILQAQADAHGCRPGLDAAAEHGHRWATEQITGGE